MPPFVGTNVFFSDGQETLSITLEEGTVEVKGGWVVVTEGDRVRSFPARVVRYVDVRS
jgi:hypothetical protein